MFVALLFWYQFFCGFSGSAMIDQWYLVFFNLFFSSLPQLITGVLDKDVPAEVLLAVPHLYRSGQNMQEYQPHMFWMNMVDALYQSLVCFFIPYFTYSDSDVDLFTWGTPITTLALLTIISHLGIETKTWTWINVASIIFSIFLFFSVALIYNSSCPTCNPPSNPYWTMQRLLKEPKFYLICLLSPVAALLPRLLYRTLQGSLFPAQLQIGRQLLKVPAEARNRFLEKLNSNAELRSPCVTLQENSHQLDVEDPHDSCNPKISMKKYGQSAEPCFPPMFGHIPTALEDKSTSSVPILPRKYQQSAVPCHPLHSQGPHVLRDKLLQCGTELESPFTEEGLQQATTGDPSDSSFTNLKTSTPRLRLMRLPTSSLHAGLSDSIRFNSSVHQDCSLDYQLEHASCCCKEHIIVDPKIYSTSGALETTFL